MSTPFTAVVFDLDGVLVETEPLWDQVRRAVARDHECPWPATATTDMMGMSTLEWAQYLHDAVGIPGSREAIADEVIDALEDRYRMHLPVLAGAVETVHAMASSHLVGLASSSPRRLIDAVIDRLNLTQAFEATVSTEEVAAGKPAPDGYLRACELLGVDPVTAVGVEDSTNGCKAVRNAGMTLIAVPPKFHRPDDEVLDTAAAVLGTLAELTDALLDGLQPQGPLA